MNIGNIDGLRFERNQLSCVEDRSSRIEYDGTRPLNVVFHGHEDKFSYEYFGIHQGTEDRLTFVGDENRSFSATFIDCREDSCTWGKKANATISPSIEKCLVIPPGVAHIFDGLEGVFTINSFYNFLPPPDEWLNGLIEWNIAADTINIHRDIPNNDLPRIRTNKHAASQTFYDLTSQNIEKSMDGIVIEYPFTHAVRFDDGSEKTLKFQKNMDGIQPKPKRIDLDNEMGIFLERRLFVTGSDGDDAGFTTMTCGTKTVFDDSVESIVSLANQNLDKIRRITFFDDPQLTFSVTVKRGSLSSTFDLSPSCFYDLVLQSDVELQVSEPIALTAIRLDEA